MLLGIFDGMAGSGLAGRLMIMFIFSVFFPLTAISFFRYMIPKKKKEYKKSLEDMGINSSKKVEDIHSGVRFLFPVGFAFSICFIAIFYIVFADRLIDSIGDSVILTGASFGEKNQALIAQSVSVLAFAFLGGFIWSATNIIRRLIANDLAPSVYYSAGIRILLASVVALVLSFLLGDKSGPEFIGFKSSLSAIAFLTGMFPERFLQYLIKVFQKLVNPDNLNTDQLSLYRIQGISMQHKERLEEMGIDNAQNLATASLTQLLIETPYKSRQILDWIGQAKLLCYAKEDMEKLQSVGIRTVFDLFSTQKTSAYLQEMSNNLGINGPLLHNIHDQVMADRGINSLYQFLNGVNTPDGEENKAASPPLKVSPLTKAPKTTQSEKPK